MKLVIFFISTLILLPCTIWAEVISTFTFNPSLLEIHSETNIIEYGDFDYTALGAHVTIPSKTYLVELTNYSEPPVVDWVVENQEQLGKIDVDNIYSDIPTSDITNRYHLITSSAEYEKLGSSPVLFLGETIISEKHWAKILVFPVTIDTNGQYYYNHSITLLIDSQMVKPEQLVPYQNLKNKYTRKSSWFQSSTSEANVEYLIITTTLLQEQMERLAQYKNSTGIKTEVELIDNILPFYSGRDDAEKLREFLKQFYADGGSYVLLAGDETQLPIRYAYPNYTNEQPAINKQQICDLYFADLTGEWDLDNDNVWGEKIADQADITPELNIGRLPFNTVEEVFNYVEKLINYETNPGQNDPTYLEKTFFFTADQMRDYSSGGQHHRVALAYPDNIFIDTINGIEITSGDDLNPTNLPSKELEEVLSEGYGFVNIINHGNYSAFSIRSSGYNHWPKSYFTTDTIGYGHGVVSNLTPNGKVSFYYSVACDNGAFDLDQPPYNLANPNMMQTLLGLEEAGAVAFIANTRWGWVSSSHLIQRVFFDSLFAHPERPAVQALYDAKAVYYYYRDQVYGLNYFGDPTLKVYSEVPGTLSIITNNENKNLVVSVISETTPVADCQIVISKSGEIISQLITDNNGTVTSEYDFLLSETYIISAIKNGYSIGQVEYIPTIITDVNDVDEVLPEKFVLEQNYPNPFNPSTMISFELSEKVPVKLSIYNILGQTVTTLKDETLAAGRYIVEWNGRENNGNTAASGIYFYRLETDSFTDVKKMVLIR